MWSYDSAANSETEQTLQKDETGLLTDEPLPTSVTHTSELTPVYEDILPPEKQKKVELQGNVAYGPVSVASECI